MDRLDKIIHKVAKKYNLPIMVVREIYDAQVKSTKNKIKEGDWTGATWLYLGKFVNIDKHRAIIAQRNLQRKKE